MKLFLSVNNNEIVIVLPVTPEQISVKSNMLNERFVSIENGEFNIIGKRALKTIRINSIFPGKEYFFNNSNVYLGYRSIQVIELLRDRGQPLRITSDDPEYPLNMAITIDSFTHVKGKDKNLRYEMLITEFAF